MNFDEMPQLDDLLQNIASFDGDKDVVYQSIVSLLCPVAGFCRLRIAGQEPGEGFSARIESTDRWLILDALASERGLTESDWQLVASVTAGTFSRLMAKLGVAHKGHGSDPVTSLIIVKDRNGRFLEVNEPFAELYGSDCESMIGKTDADFHSCEQLCERFIADDRRAIDSGEPVHIPHEKNIRCKDGKITHFETVKVPLKNSDGDFDRVLVVATPQSKQSTSTFSLGFQNSFLFKMIDYSPNWIIVKDREGRFVFANDAFCRVFGREKRDVIGKTYAELMPASEWVDNFAKDDMEVIEKQQKKFILEEMTTDPDGNEHWVQTVKKPVIEPDGSCDRVLIVCVPIDEQRKAAAKLKENEQFLREVIDSNPNLIVVKDEAGTFLLANEAVAKFYGVTTDALLGKCDADFNPNAEEVEGFRKIEKGVFETGEPQNIDAEKVTDHAGNSRWFQTIKKTTESKQTKSQLLVVCSDITEQVKVKESLELAKERAVSASHAKTEFLTRMSHELRTPLNAILGFNQLLQQDDNLTEEQFETLGIINKSGKHLLNLISDVLEMSKVEMGESALNLGKVRLAKLVEDTVELFVARASANDCKLTYTVFQDVPDCIEGDEVKLRQIILNFISNAVKFTHDGEIKVIVEKVADARLRVSVIDNGPGIAASELDQVFGLFRQTETGRKSEEGTGLGLSISKSLVELMGGQIAVLSEEGKGANFFFEIPFIAISRPTVKAVTTTSEANNTGGEGYQVLVVDDAEVNRKFVTRLLARLGYETIEATNGLEAVASHLNDHPDLILMDVKMPEMDGMTATATIRENEERYEIDRVPIIAVTANAFEEHRRRAKEVGCDGFIAKPFEFADLIEAISKEIDKS